MNRLVDAIGRGEERQDVADEVALVVREKWRERETQGWCENKDARVCRLLWFAGVPRSRILDGMCLVPDFPFYHTSFTIRC